MLLPASSDRVPIQGIHPVGTRTQLSQNTLPTKVHDTNTMNRIGTGTMYHTNTNTSVHDIWIHVEHAEIACFP